MRPASSVALGRREIQPVVDRFRQSLRALQRRSPTTDPCTDDERSEQPDGFVARCIAAAEELAMNPEIQRIVAANAHFQAVLTEATAEYRVAQLNGRAERRPDLSLVEEIDDDDQDDERRQNSGIVLAAAIGAVMVPLSDNDEQTSDDKPSFSEAETTVSESDDDEASSLPPLSDSEDEDERVPTVTYWLRKLATVPPFSWVLRVMNGVRDVAAVPLEQRSGVPGRSRAAPVFVRLDEIGAPEVTDPDAVAERAFVERVILSMAWCIIAVAMLHRVHAVA